MSMHRVLLAGVLCMLTLSAAAFERSFPRASKRGTLTPAIYPGILIDGKARNLAAGGRIWNQENLIEQPASLRETNVPVNYTENDQGEIDRIWMLRPEEVATELSLQITPNSPQ